MAKPGCGPIAAIIVILVGLVLFGTNEFIGYYFSECEEEEVFDCLLGLFEDEPEPEGVVATGVYSYKDYSVTVTANIPLEGGNVTGSVSGACEGSVKGTYDGQSGVIKGRLAGSCDPFVIKIPSSADFNGSVNKAGKTVPIDFNAKGGSFTHNGSMVLTYQ
ncbi:MAG: hypothetical protein Q7R81_03820 [Candidatus Peregrinibacteria bacterium]|nr:hypothetical protein [Candidatus Peregrinibacteria bacterium]